MAFRSGAIGRERLTMLRGVLDSAASRSGVLRGTKEHEELAVRLLQLADIIGEKERLVAALSSGAASHRPVPRNAAAASADKTMT